MPDSWDVQLLTVRYINEYQLSKYVGQVRCQTTAHLPVILEGRGLRGFTVVNYAEFPHHITHGLGQRRELVKTLSLRT